MQETLALRERVESLSKGWQHADPVAAALMQQLYTALSKDVLRVKTIFTKTATMSATLNAPGTIHVLNAPQLLQLLGNMLGRQLESMQKRLALLHVFSFCTMEDGITFNQLIAALHLHSLYDANGSYFLVLPVCASYLQ